MRQFLFRWFLSKIISPVTEVQHDYPVSYQIFTPDTRCFHYWTFLEVVCLGYPCEQILLLHLYASPKAVIMQCYDFFRTHYCHIVALIYQIIILIWALLLPWRTYAVKDHDEHMQWKTCVVSECVFVRVMSEVYLRFWLILFYSLRAGCKKYGCYQNLSIFAPILGSRRCVIKGLF